jgi:hypothetical protein
MIQILDIADSYTLYYYELWLPEELLPRR